jgi:hypothetical protein
MGKFSKNVRVLFVDKDIKCVAPEDYVFMPNEYVLNSIINKESEDNVVSILLCDRSKIMRMVYTTGDVIKTQSGNIKKAVAVLNSEIGMLEYKTIKKASMVAFPAIWYMDSKKCAIINGNKDIPFVAVPQMNKKRSDIILDFVVDVEMRRIYGVVLDIHEKMLQERVNDDVANMIKLVFKSIDPIYYKTIQKSFDTTSMLSIYKLILDRASAYTPQFRIKVEKLCGAIYGRFL